jgi:hypothetical protein
MFEKTIEKQLNEYLVGNKIDGWFTSDSESDSQKNEL